MIPSSRGDPNTWTCSSIGVRNRFHKNVYVFIGTQENSTLVTIIQSTMQQNIIRWSGPYTWARTTLPETFLRMLWWVYQGVSILMREMRKALTIIDLYGKQTTEHNSRKRAPRANDNSRMPSALYRGSNDINNLKFSRHHDPCCRRP